MPTLRRSVIWLILARAGILAVVVLVTLLLGRTSAFVQPVTVLAVLVFSLSVLYSVALKLGLSPDVLVPIQLGNDVLLVAWIAYRTGDVESPFNALYLVVVFAASFFARRRPFVVTLVFVGAAIAVGSLTVWGVIPRSDGSTYASASVPELQLSLSYTVVATASVAVLSMYLANRQIRSESALEAASRRLADLRAFNERIIESMRSGLITAGLDGLMSSCNRAAEEITGLAESDIVGRPIESVFGASAREYLNGVERADATLLRTEASFERPDGSVARIGFNVAPLTYEGDDVRGVVVIFQDLTDFYELEQEVRRREKLAALGTMAAGLAHEIRNPLASIRGSAQVLASEIPADDASRRMLEIIGRESERLNRTLTDFLTFARPAPFTPKEFDLKRTVSEAVALLKNSAEVGPEHVVEESYPEGECVIVGDANQVRQIFWNLARNGLQAMPAGGRLSVRLEPRASGGYRLTVADGGVGIPEAQLGRLFEPFASTKPNGTGLGMAIVYQFVQDHGGRVSVESEVGAGTRVAVDLRERPAAPGKSRSRGAGALDTESTLDPRRGDPA